MKIKLLKDLVRYNVMGYDKELVTANEGDVIELSTQRANQLIKAKLAVDADAEPVKEEETQEETNGPLRFKVLSDESMTHICGLGKDEIEVILRHYGHEVDKRKNLNSIRQELVNVMNGAPLHNNIGSDISDLIKFHKDHFRVDLGKSLFCTGSYYGEKLDEIFYAKKEHLKSDFDKAEYAKQEIQRLNSNMASILIHAFKNENS